MNQEQQTEAEVSGRLDRLLRLLESDPRNLNLLADAAETALIESRPEVTKALLERYAAIATLPPQQTNLAGLAALQLNRFEEAADAFQSLVEAGADDKAVKFNLAWSLAMAKQFDRALAQLSEATARELPQAAMLEIQILHEKGEFEAAAEKASRYVEMHPNHVGLMAAISVLALDVEDEALAQRCAVAAGEHPDALTTLGTLALGNEQVADALEMFDRALDRNEGVPRAWVGRGLAKLLSDDTGDAATDIDRGAEMFGDHLGSWIAAGWAHFVKGDVETCRARFTKALEIDPTFAETHGSLAVLDVLAGDLAKARERTQIALRLDRQCYSAALAGALLSAQAGDQATAQQIFETALNMPVDAEGRTIAQALARMGAVRTR